MLQWNSLLRTALFSLFSVYAWQTSGATDIVERHRAVTNEREPELSRKTDFVIQSEDASGTLKIRCLPNKGLSAEIEYARSVGRVDPDAGIRVTYQANDGSVSQDKAWPIGRSRAILPNARQILEDTMKSAALHIQLDILDGPTAHMVFQSKGVPEPLHEIQADCPSDAPPPDQTGLAK